MPKLGIVVSIEEAYTRRSKALIRSDLWNPEQHIDRSELPSSGEILRSPNDPSSTSSDTTASAPSATPAAKASTSRRTAPAEYVVPLSRGVVQPGRAGGTFQAVQQVLVLNASYEPLNVTSVRRAHVLVFKGKAEVIEELDDQPLRSATDTYPSPHVIRLLTYVRVPRIIQRKISRRALFARDNWRCVYCGETGGRLTLDHVVPRSKGGGSEWENVVTSCAPCNLRKGDRLLEEVSMTLHSKPRAPAPVLFIRLAAHTIPTRWQPYLDSFGGTSTGGSAVAA